MPTFYYFYVPLSVKGNLQGLSKKNLAKIRKKKRREEKAKTRKNKNTKGIKYNNCWEKSKGT